MLSLGVLLYSTLAVLVVPLPSYAQPTCDSDFVKKTICGDPIDDVTSENQDLSIKETWNDSSKKHLHSFTDSVGNKIYRYSFGNILSGNGGSAENGTSSDRFGNILPSYADSFDDNFYQDNFGKTVRCQTDEFGNISCR